MTDLHNPDLKLSKQIMNSQLSLLELLDQEEVAALEKLKKNNSSLLYFYFQIHADIRRSLQANLIYKSFLYCFKSSSKT